MRKLLFIVLCLFAVAALATETLVLQPGPTDGKDAYVNNKAGTTNYGSYELILDNMSG